MSGTRSPESAARYRFAGNDGAVWLGLSPTPLASLAVTVTLTVAFLYVGLALPAVVAMAAVGVGATLVPVAGRLGVEWVAPGARQVGVTAAAGRSWSAGLCPVPVTSARPLPVLRLPREYGRLRLRSLLGGTLGVIEDSDRSATVVLSVAGADRFALLDPDEQTGRLTGWGNALASLAADPGIRRLQWVERAGPDLRDGAGWLCDRAETAGEDAEAVADYAALAHQLGGGAVRHEVWVAVQLVSQLGAASEAVLAARVREIATVLLAADLLAAPLRADEIGWLLRRFADHGAAESAVTPSAGQLGPSSRHIGWSELRTDDTWHRSFAVAGWPRIPLVAGWLEPLLGGASPHAVRTVSVHLQPVAVAAAAREARAARTRARLDSADRDRLGFSDAPVAAWAEAEAAGTEEELLAGYRLHRVAGVVTCSAPSRPALEDAVRAVRAAAAASRVDLRPLHGQHDLGFLACLPLCRVQGSSS